MTAAVAANVTTAAVAANVTTADVSANISAANITVNISGTGGSGHTIQDEGDNLAQRTNLNFVGDGVTVTDDSANNATVVTIPGGGGSGTSLTVTAGEDLLQNDLIYIAADGNAYKADAMFEAKEAIGVISDDVNNGDAGTAYVGQRIITGLVGLTVGGRYFLSDTQPGGISDAIPDGLSIIVQQVGKALTETSLLFFPQDSVLTAPGDAASDYRITEDGQSRVTESGNYRILELTVAQYRITENGTFRVTENGNYRVNE